MRNAMEKPLVNKKVKLEKFPGKGGWTYARVPEIPPDKKAWFNWVRVKGSIDGHVIKAYHLMSMGKGELFLPVKAAIRKKIGKEAGDMVQVILYKDDEPVHISDEFLDCLRDEPDAHRRFMALSDSDKKKWIDWIDSAKKDETRVDRMARTIEEVRKGTLFVAFRER
jgi:hypothetical protein